MGAQRAFTDSGHKGRTGEGSKGMYSPEDWFELDSVLLRKNQSVRSERVSCEG